MVASHNQLHIDITADCTNAVDALQETKSQLRSRIAGLFLTTWPSPLLMDNFEYCLSGGTGGSSPATRRPPMGAARTT